MSCNTGFLGPVGKFLPDVNKIEYNPQFKALPEGEEFVDIPETIMGLRLVSCHLIF